MIVLGAGPAGLSAALYGSRYNLKVAVIGKDMGPMTETDEIDNYLGFPSISGLELSKKFQEHVEKFGIKIFWEEVVEIRKEDDFFVVRTIDNEYKAKTVIYALGGVKRKLGLPEEDKFKGRGISYCATCDAAFFRDKTVAVTGGSDAAAGSALLLSKFAKQVYIIYRRDKLRAFPYMVKLIDENEKIKCIFNSVIKEVRGENVVESVIIENTKTGEKSELKLDGIFVEFGHDPNSEIAKKLGVDVSDGGRIKVKNDMSTSVEGFFAAGDITTGSNQLDQIITAASEGAIAADSAYNFLSKR